MISSTCNDHIHNIEIKILVSTYILCVSFCCNRDKSVETSGSIIVDQSVELAQPTIHVTHFNITINSIFCCIIRACYGKSYRELMECKHCLSVKYECSYLPAAGK